MTKFPAILALIGCALVCAFAAKADDQTPSMPVGNWDIRGLSQVIPGLPESQVDYDIAAEVLSPRETPASSGIRRTAGHLCNG